MIYGSILLNCSRYYCEVPEACDIRCRNLKVVVNRVVRNDYRTLTGSETFLNTGCLIKTVISVEFTILLKFAVLFISVLLPGFYTSLGTFDPEMFPTLTLNKIAVSIAGTPMSLMSETLLILLVYEIMRESGLRMPQPLGYAVSIVGGLVIGDTAINAGLIGAPTLMVVAISAICSYIIPNLYAPAAILRILFTIAGGIGGIWGLSAVFCMVFVELCAKTSFGIPYTSPITPPGVSALRDVFIRAGWKTLSKKQERIQNMPGSEVKEKCQNV